METNRGISLLSDEAVGDVKLGLELVLDNLERLRAPSMGHSNHDLDFRIRMINEMLEKINDAIHPTILISDNHKWEVNLLNGTLGA